MKNDDRDELDDVIDGALPGYSSAEPLEGLEDRVLQRVHLSGEAPRIRWPYRWGFALAGLLAAGVALWMGRTPPRAMNVTPVAVFKPPSPPPAAQVAPPARARAKVRRRVKSLPKEYRFPAPAPLTDEERVLAAWAMRAPVEAGQVFADLRKRSDEPVTIQAITIPPLEIDGTQ